MNFDFIRALFKYFFLSAERSYNIAAERGIMSRPFYGGNRLHKAAIIGNKSGTEKRLLGLYSERFPVYAGKKLASTLTEAIECRKISSK
jgi:hypothetical protein